MRFFLLLFITFFVISSQAQVVNVSNATQLQNALNAAVPGQTIILADGIYSKSGSFIIPARNGTADSPITLKGDLNAIITCSNLSSGYGLSVRGSHYWIFDGFSISNCSKGIVLDSSNHCIVKNITIRKIGSEGIHLRCYSSFCTVENCFVDSTGLTSPGTGEGIYIGSAVSNWPTYTNANPDTCNYNVITENSFGDHVLSENIDIKEGTTGGVIAFNNFNGSGLNGVNYGDSWIDVKGNGYNIYCNTGMNTILDGFQTHIAVAGWGDNNVFANNTLNVNNASGYGILISTSSSEGTATNNMVCSNNSAIGAGNGLTNISTQSCSGSCTLVVMTGNSSLQEEEIKVFPNPIYRSGYFVVPEVFLEGTYTLLDATGRIIISGKITEQKTGLIFENIPSGIYLLSLASPGNIKSVKIIMH